MTEHLSEKIDNLKKDVANGTEYNHIDLCFAIYSYTLTGLSFFLPGNRQATVYGVLKEVFDTDRIKDTDKSLYEAVMAYSEFLNARITILECENMLELGAKEIERLEQVNENNIRLKSECSNIYNETIKNCNIQPQQNQ